MKKIVFTSLVCLCCCTAMLQAQTEVKLSPLALIAGVGYVSLEHGVSDDFGVELNLYGGGDFFGGHLSAKYYFNPHMGLDRFHIGAFGGSGFSDGNVGIGFLLGSKIISRKNVLFEFGGGLGRSFDGEGGVGFLKLDVGYRFGG